MINEGPYFANATVFQWGYTDRQWLPTFRCPSVDKQLPMANDLFAGIDDQLVMVEGWLMNSFSPHFRGLGAFLLLLQILFNNKAQLRVISLLRYNVH